MTDRADLPIRLRQQIVERRFIDWHGLTVDCIGREVFPELPPPHPIPVQRFLGDSFHSVDFYVLAIEGYYRPTASLEGERLVLFDGMLPDLGESLPSLLHDFGEPAARLDWYYGTLVMVGGEWVYPGRGLTLFLNTDRDRALHIALFAPATLADYLDHLRPHLRKRLRP